MKWSDRESRELVKDYLDLEGPYDFIEDISKVFNLTSDYVAIQITEDLGWKEI